MGHSGSSRSWRIRRKIVTIRKVNLRLGSTAFFSLFFSYSLSSSWQQCCQATPPECRFDYYYCSDIRSASSADYLYYITTNTVYVFQFISVINFDHERTTSVQYSITRELYPFNIRYVSSADYRRWSRLRYSSRFNFNHERTDRG